MYFKYDEVEDYTEVFTETTDICVTCRYFDLCPFIGALENHVVYPSANNIEIEECAMYALDFDEISEN